MSLLETVKELLDLDPQRAGPTNIIDGGCHHGVFARKALEIFPEANIIGFEPDPESWRSAVNALAKNPQVEIVNAALAGEQGRAEFFRGANSATNSLSPRPEGSAKPYYPKSATLSGGATVGVTTIDQECARRSIKNVDLLKLDLQGGELEALKGAQALLSENRIQLILCEVVFIAKYQSQPLFWRLCQHLDQFGFSLFYLDDLKIGLYDGHPTDLRQRQWNQADALFLSTELRKRLDA